MSPALNLDKAPGQINHQKVDLPSSHEMETSTQKSETSQDDTISRDLDSTVSTTQMTTTHSSEEAISPPPTVPSRTVFPFFRLPPELRDQIYIYASLAENVWIGRLPRVSKDPYDVIVEKASTHKPAILVRTEHSIVSACHQTRDEFRTAMWREYMTTTRKVRFRVCDLAFEPLEELFANCSEAEANKLRKTNKCRVHHHITPALHAYARSDREYWEWELVDLLDAWLMFETRAPMDAEQSVDRYDWYSIRLLRTALLENVSHIPEWANRWESVTFTELWEAIDEAYEQCSINRAAHRYAHH